MASWRWPDGLWPGYRDELLGVFRMIDDDNNGVDFRVLLELGKGINAIEGHGSLTPEKCTALLGRMDDNRDGSVTQSEFLEFFGKVMEGKPRASNDKGMAQIRKAAETHVLANVRDPAGQKSFANYGIFSTPASERSSRATTPDFMYNTGGRLHYERSCPELGTPSTWQTPLFENRQPVDAFLEEVNRDSDSVLQMMHKMETDLDVPCGPCGPCGSCGSCGP